MLLMFLKYKIFKLISLLYDNYMYVFKIESLLSAGCIKKTDNSFYFSVITFVFLKIEVKMFKYKIISNTIEWRRILLTCINRILRN